MNRNDIITTLRAMNIPSDKYIVTMGAVLSVHGIRTAGDIDIIFDPSLEKDLEEKGFVFSPTSHDVTYRKRYVSGDIEAFPNFYNIGTFKECLQKYTREMVDGIPFMSLQDVLHVKSLFGREKDVVDIRGGW
jgi:hypothetical protein